jgi:YesN/AraC family two-component response regulator
MNRINYMVSFDGDNWVSLKPGYGNVSYAEEQTGEDEITVKLSFPQGESQFDELKNAVLHLINNFNISLIQKINNKIVEIARLPVHSKRLSLPDHFNSDPNFCILYDTISRFYSSKTGISIDRELINQRMIYVKELLINTDLTITEIAYRTHYCNKNYLCSQFNNEIGEKPCDYRKLHKTGEKP